MSDELRAWLEQVRVIANCSAILSVGLVGNAGDHGVTVQAHLSFGFGFKCEGPPYTDGPSFGS